MVRLAADGRITAHTEQQLDAMLLVVTGCGAFGAGPADGPQPLTEGPLVRLPHGAPRSVTAGAAGLVHVTTHRHRPGMRIGPGPDA